VLNNDDELIIDPVSKEDVEDPLLVELDDPELKDDTDAEDPMLVLLEDKDDPDDTSDEPAVVSIKIMSILSS